MKKVFVLNSVGGGGITIQFRSPPPPNNKMALFHCVRVSIVWEAYLKMCFCFVLVLKTFKTKMIHFPQRGVVWSYPTPEEIKHVSMLKQTKNHNSMYC